VGEFKEDSITGKGIYVWKDGRRYEGEFVDGKRTGGGVLTWQNGD
jgi:hypothetical protein